MVANYKSDRCPNITDYDATVTYPLGSCVSYNGHVWYASADVIHLIIQGRFYS